jgi:hypothetical protein
VLNPTLSSKKPSEIADGSCVGVVGDVAVGVEGTDVAVAVGDAVDEGGMGVAIGSAFPQPTNRVIKTIVLTKDLSTSFFLFVKQQVG